MREPNEVDEDADADADAGHERAARIRIGATVAGKWRLADLLGTGATGAVYAAQHRNGRKVAIKILHSELAANARVRKRFLSEGYAANATNHPDAVAILDDGEDAGLVYLVMELLTGETLDSRLRRGALLASGEAVGIGIALLRILSAAHDAGILHRDVKPSNTFITTHNGVKLLDFGAARIREDGEFVTRSGAVLGTPAFMAPEAASGAVDMVDARSDIWSVGATLFLALTGVTVHAARSVNEALVAAATRKAPSIASVAPGVHPDVARVIDRALEFHQDARWPNARAMLDALESVDLPSAGFLTAPLLAVPANETIPDVEAAGTQSQRRRYALLASLVALTAGATYWASHGRRAPESPTSADSKTRASLPLSPAPLVSVVNAGTNDGPVTAPAPKAATPATSINDASNRGAPPRAAHSGGVANGAARRSDDLDDVLDRRK